MQREDLPDIKCPRCHRLLARGTAVFMELYCRHCKVYVILRATSPNSAPHDGHQTEFQNG
ncbi:Com family DNA-binding transcriptional regulator [uncultured Desulfovibrio sp.]|uniref:Com family DNA-binding transcriptional regulator n=1 Tax=uncultured Desulfovibrio sp. TaxID=167968 RepID=UPI0034C6DAE0